MASAEPPAAPVCPSALNWGLQNATTISRQVQNASLKNSAAVALSFRAAFAGLGRLRAHAVDVGERALHEQVSVAAEWAKLKGVQHAYELQTQSARKALDLCETALTEGLEILAAAIAESTRPISERLTSVLSDLRPGP